MIYQADPNAVRDAQEQVDDLEYERRIQILRDELEVYEKQKEQLEEKKTQIEEYYEKLTEETNEYYDQAIQRIEDYKSKFEELAEAEENALMEARLESLGLSMESILSLDEGSFESFKDMYLGLLNDIYGQNTLMQQSLTGAWGELPSYMDMTEEAMNNLNRIDLSSFEAAMATLNQGIQSLQDLNPEAWPVAFDEISGGFDGIKTAVDGVKDAVNGVSSAVNGSGGSSGSGTGTSAEGSGEATDLASAISDLDDLASARLGEEGVLGKFETIQKYIVEDLIPAINGPENSLYSAIKEVCNEEYEISIAITPVGPPQLLAQMGYYGEEKGNLPTAGAAKALGFANGTVGAAFFDGYPGLDSPEHNAIRSEFGQPELTVYPNGTYEITTTPTISDLPKGTVIFNEEQTNRILKNSGKKNGKAFANGTNYLPLQDAMPEKASIFERFNANLQDNIAKIASNISDMTSGIRDIAHNITNITNNGNVGSSVVFSGDINVTCPGITEAEVAKNIGGALRTELNGIFTGFSLRADQRAMRR